VTEPVRDFLIDFFNQLLSNIGISSAVIGILAAIFGVTTHHLVTMRHWVGVQIFLPSFSLCIACMLARSREESRLPTWPVLIALPVAVSAVTFAITINLLHALGV
jgi:hypothetical protein